MPFSLKGNVNIYFCLRAAQRTVNFMGISAQWDNSSGTDGLFWKTVNRSCDSSCISCV